MVKVRTETWQRRQEDPKLTSKTRVVKLDIPQTGVVQHLKLGLVDLGNVGEVLAVVGIRLLGVGPVLLVAHVEPGRGDHGELDVLPLALGQGSLHQLQLVQVGDGAGSVV